MAGRQAQQEVLRPLWLKRPKLEGPRSKFLNGLAQLLVSNKEVNPSKRKSRSTKMFFQGGGGEEEGGGSIGF